MATAAATRTTAGGAELGDYAGALLRALARDDDVLVVVGALHLLGEDGVVEKLQAKGYQVERVCSACAR